MRWREPLTAWQRHVLQWVAEGCPGRELEVKNRYKTSAAALASRGLIRVSRREGWQAVLTEAGQFYHQHGAFPDEPQPTENQRTTAAVTRSRAAPTTRPTPPASDTATRSPKSPQLSVASDATATASVARGHRRRHPVATYLAEHRDYLEVTAAVRPRALRLLQSLAAAAESRGWQVRPVGLTHDRHGYRQQHARRDGHLEVVIGDDVFKLRLIQETDQRPHVPTTKELADQARNSWARIPAFDQVPTDRLRLELLEVYGGRVRWADGKRLRLEDKLLDLLAALQQRAEAAVARRQQQRQEAEEQYRRWQAAVEDARNAYGEARRRQALLDEVHRWQEVTAIRQYCDALAADGGADDWIAWARAYADKIDPLRAPRDGVPTVPAPSPGDLVPFMKQDLNPYMPPYVPD